MQDKAIQMFHPTEDSKLSYTAIKICSEILSFYILSRWEKATNGVQEVVERRTKTDKQINNILYKKSHKH